MRPARQAAGWFVWLASDDGSGAVTPASTTALRAPMGTELAQTRDESVGIVDRERVAGSSPHPINGWGVPD